MWGSCAKAAEPVHAHGVASAASVSAEGLWSQRGLERLTAYLPKLSRKENHHAVE